MSAQFHLYEFEIANDQKQSTRHRVMSDSYTNALILTAVHAQTWGSYMPENQRPTSIKFVGEERVPGKAEDKLNAMKYGPPKKGKPNEDVK